MISFIRRPRRTAAGLLTAALFWAAASAASSAAPRSLFDDPPDFAPTGLQPHKAYFSQLPFEAIDMVNGGLVLTFTDLALPGDAGMDLRIVRSFNQQVNGGWWQVGIGGVPILVEHPDGNGAGGEGSHVPVLVMADGSRHKASPRDENYNDTVFITDQFWRYTTTSTARTLEMPNGWVATYELGIFSGGAMLTGVADVYGNTITPTWKPDALRPLKLDYVTQSVGDTSRTVTFAYSDPDCPHTVPSAMSYAGRTWTYACGSTQLPNGGWQSNMAVTPPVGLGWLFNWNGYGLTGGMTVTTPHGGTVSYTFADQILPSTDVVHRSVVATRTTGGRDITPGTWTFTYEQSSSVPARGTVVDSFDRSIEFNSEWLFQQKWLLVKKILKEESTVVSTATRDYQELPYTEIGHAAAVPTFDKLVQDDEEYTVAYSYEGEFGNFHQPSTIVETGQLTRTTVRTFNEDFTPYLLNRVASEAVTVAGGGTFTKGWDHDQTTGFLEVESVYGVTTNYGADTRGNRISATDAENRVTGFSYQAGVVKDTTTPMYTITRSINTDGTVASETQDGKTTSFSYTAGRLSLVTPPAGFAIEHQYDDNAGTWARVVRGATNPTDTTTLLDGFGRSRGTWNAEDVRTTIEYDADGRKTFESSSHIGNVRGEGDTFIYDALNRVKRIDRADGEEVHYSYSATTVAIEDEKGHVTTQTWAAFGRPDDRRLVSVTDAANKTWSYTYTTLGGLTGVNQPDGPDRSWSYNSHHWLESETHPESGVTNYTHDDVGNVLSKEIVGREITIEYRYDDNNRLTDILAGGAPHDVDLFYDARDNRTGLVNGTVNTTIDYDDANRPWKRTDVIDGESFVTQYGYDGHDNLASVTYPSGRMVTYSYDEADRIEEVTGPGGVTWASSLLYHPSGAVGGYTSGNGKVTSITYDNRQRPDLLTSGPLSLDYAYDDVGNVTGINDTRSGFDQTFEYDAVDRLVKVNDFGAVTYEYDARGNRTKRNGVTHDYNGSDRLTSDGTTSFTYDGAGNALTVSGQTYTYTPFNVVATATVGGAVTTYRYDGDNQRRLRIRANGTKDYFVPGPGLVPLAEYRKAPGGSRVLVREYIYAGDRLIASVGLEPAIPAVTWTDPTIVPDVTAVKAVHLTELREAVNAARVAHGLGAVNWTSATVQPGVMVIQTVHIAELRTAINAVYTAAGVPPPTYTDPTLVAGVTDIRGVHLTELRTARTNVPQAEVTATRFYHLDALGSVRAVTDPAQATVRLHDYAAFGEEPTPASGADTRRFTGKERDTETGLDYFSARYYLSTTGRFTTVDPYNVVSEAQDEADFIAYLSAPQRWNRYAYSLNNPGKFKDPDGRNPFAVTALIGAGVYGGWRALQNALNDRPVMEGVYGEAAKGLVIGGTLGLAGPVASDLASAAALGLSAALGRSGLQATAKELNQVAHVFGRPEKNLADLVNASGSEIAALRNIQAAANSALRSGHITVGPNGILPGRGNGVVLDVNGVRIRLIGGRVIDGVVELGSFEGVR